VSARRQQFFVFAIAVLIVGGCAGNGCGGCAMEPLPAGGLPADQTLEGGAQIRVTPQGFNKLTAIADDVLNDALAGGMCMARRSVNLLVGDLTFCARNDGTCTPGCKVNFNIDSIAFTPQAGNLRVRTQFDVSTRVPAQLDTLLGTIGPCTLDVRANNNVVDVNVAFSIRPSDGELRIELASISNLDINPSITGCSFVGSVIDFIAGAFASLIEVNFIANLLRPLINNLLQGFLPDPLGIEGMLGVGGLLGAVQPDIAANLETRVVPGGYVFLERGGMSLGVITGFNADEDPRTRTADLDSEPALCVPRFGAPDFAAVPLPRTSRQTFGLAGADLFRGVPEPAGDLAIGVSETFLDLVGHHLVSSGAMCLGLGTAQIPQLTLGTVGLFVPSLAELGSPSGADPLLLVTRPLRPVGFTVGDGTTASPSITVHIEDFELDFYAFLFERYTRGFTLSLDMNIGLNLEFTTDASGQPAVLPILVGLESSNVGIKVLNEEFLREDRAVLESVLPSILDIALQVLDDNMAPFPLPEFAGFSLANLSTQKVTTSQDEFVAITATLGTGTMMRELAERYPSVADRVDRMAAAEPVPAARGAARLVEVDTPPIAIVKRALLGLGGRLPVVVVEAPSHDAIGRPLEWAWSIGGGLWRPYQPGGTLRLTDRAFALQGRYELHLLSRVAGDYRTTDAEPTVFSLVIDSVPPRILGDELEVSGERFTVRAVDLVSPPEEIRIALGRAGADRPATPWGDGRFDLALARTLAGPSGELTIFAEDSVGNQAVLAVEAPDLLYFHGGGQGGCNCGVSDGGGAAGAGAPIGLAALLGLGFRRRLPWRRLGRSARTLLVVLAAGLGPACSCGDGAADVCEVAEDCALACDGKVPLCLNGECLCQNEIATGSIGQYSEMAVTPGGTIYVSAYNRTHGDLMVAAVTRTGRIRDEEWAFIDGVPDGPVVVENSTVRGGVGAPGVDCGLYTDVATFGEAAMVSYFDKDNGSLKFSTNVGGSWQNHTVEAGRPGVEDQGYEIVGQYSSITVDRSGRPGIAYFAMYQEPGSPLTTELRFAQASSSSPQREGDWTIHVVDRLEITPPSQPDPLTIPRGTGLFVTAARLPDERPVLAYYDRVAGDLKLARGAAGGAGFEAPEVLDGADGSDVGWHPGLFVDSSGELHVTYVSSSNDDLLYVNTIDRTPEVIDDGYRLVGQTEDGLPKPEFHFVGDDSAIVLTAVGPYVAYQDATTHELRVANKGPDGTWRHKALAGHEDPFVGAYGFYASAALDAGSLIISTWVIDQPNAASWVEILRATPVPIE
jgi:MYXO-CTERM domain-containing protein